MTLPGTSPRSTARPASHAAGSITEPDAVRRRSGARGGRGGGEVVWSRDDGGGEDTSAIER